MRRSIGIAAGLVLLVALVPFPRGASEPAAPRPAERARQWRGPIALALSPNGKTLWCAGHKSGTLIEIDAASRSVAREHPVGTNLSALNVAPDGGLIACDEGADQVVLLKADADGLHIRARIPVGAAPVGLVAARDGRRCWAACLWGRRVDVIDLAAGKVAGTIAVPFRPRGLALTADARRLIVADNFGSRLAVIDVAAGKVTHTLDVPGHNVRGMVVAGDRLLFTQMILNELETNTHQAVFWGSLMTSVVRDLHLPSTLAGEPHPLHRSRTYFLGEVHVGSGDPYAVLPAGDGQVLVTLSGVDQLAVFRPDMGGNSVRRIDVGRRPTAIALSADGKLAYVADTLDDTVSVVDIARDQRTAVIALGPTPPVTPAVAGERLFFDARLSLDGWLSCQSCHTDGHSPGLTADTQADGVAGSPKRIKSLAGTGDLKRWSWVGKFHRLEDQIKQSILTTQQGSEPTSAQVAALAAYLRTLPARRPPAPADRQAVARGRAIFEKQDCARCHKGPAFTDDTPHDVGLRDDGGNTKFVPPSLRGIAENGPYFHDGRAAELRDVFGKFKHQLQGTLTAAETVDLVEYLRSL